MSGKGRFRDHVPTSDGLMLSVAGRSEPAMCLKRTPSPAPTGATALIAMLCAQLKSTGAVICSLVVLKLQELIASGATVSSRVRVRPVRVCVPL